ncbi:MAG TPA: type II secretion system protein [Candidatus Eremiobacteraeota bacterium]|nr:MAG: Type II secretion system protein J precursor [bacterium ADurb.Bin363]HPZ06667.1 type II secretion system protein [Candidatus Eremiobacteraeota bacterium]
MRKVKGFTLIELVVGIFVFALLCTATFLIFSYGMRTAAYNATRVQSQQTARIAMERMVSEARNATFLPAQIMGNYTPKIPPSPVFIPYITDPNQSNVFCFTEPIPDVGAEDFNFAVNQSYRLVCYYVENRAGERAGFPGVFDKANSPDDPGGITSLMRGIINLKSTLTEPLTNLNWSITSSPLEVAWDWDPADPNTNPATIVSMPYPSDFIYFKVSHKEKPEYYDQRQVEFNGIIGRDNTHDPFEFKIEMTVVQYPYGQIVDPNKQDIIVELDSIVQVRSSY